MTTENQTISRNEGGGGMVENALAIPIGALKYVCRGGGGALDRAKYRKSRLVDQIRLTWQDREGLKVAGSVVAVIIQSTPATAVLTIANATTTVKLTSTRVTYGSRFYFECPECLRRSGVLYLRGEGSRIACRKCHKLSYRSQSVGQRSFWKGLKEKTGFPQRTLRLWLSTAGRMALNKGVRVAA